MVVNKIPTQTQNDIADSTWNNDKLKPVLDSYADTINEIENYRFSNKNAAKFFGKLPPTTNFSDDVIINASSLGIAPIIIAFRIKNANNIWVDFLSLATASVAQNSSNLVIHLSNAALAGRDFELVAVRNF